MILDLDEHDFEFLRIEYKDHWMGFKREDVGTWFLKAGLEKISVDSVGEDCCATSRCEYYYICGLWGEE